jgi:four helix bundle protein
MKIPFEQLDDAWKKACQLSVTVYNVFGEVKNYYFYNQITRVLVSVPANIAEGSERQTAKEIFRMLQAMISRLNKSSQ